MTTAARAEEEIGFSGGGAECVAFRDVQTGKDEKLVRQLAIVQQGQHGLAFRHGEIDVGLVVAGEFLGLDLRLDRSLDDRLDLEQTLGGGGRLGAGIGWIRFREILFVNRARAERGMLPGLVGGVGEDRREELGQREEDIVHRSLRGATAQRITGIAVHPVLGDIDVNRRKIGGAELVERVEDFAEFISLVGLTAFADHGVESLEDPAIEQRHVGRRHAVGLRIEAIEVSKKNAQRVAEAAIRFGHLFEEVFSKRHLVLPVHRGDPEADNIGTVFVIEMGGIDRLSSLLGLRLRELLLVLVHHEAVGHHGLVGCHAAPADAEHERALEPAAVLIGGFEVKVGGCVKLGMGFQHRDMRAAGIDPDIKRVATLLHALGQA